ncbi:DUF535 domain-containing protein [Enterobacteriaceae bacterium 89]|nr:DUF535 domain-containing protein [Enterobacteriaceae bacterium 89]
MTLIADISYSESESSVSGSVLFRQLHSGAMQPGLAWQNPKYRRKFMLRSLLTPITTAKWLSRLAAHPQLSEILQIQPGLPCRLHRPWLSLNMPRKTACEAIAQHYQSMASKLPHEIMQGYLSRGGVELAALIGRDEKHFSIRLLADAFQDKEGEATFVFCDADNTVLAELTFTLCQFNGKQTLYIGGMQGAKAHVSHELIQSATKSCNGLFPKRLLVEVAMVVGQVMGVKEIRAVSNETHIYRSVRYRKKKQDKLHADYNAFWESLSATVDSNGDYLLPLTMPRKPMEEIASKKRSEYRRRYELLDSLQAQTAQTCER